MVSEFVAQIIIAIVQGLTEWFPVSSSGHLVLFSFILDYANTIKFDVALHLGTLMAVFVYFGKDITDIIEDILRGNWKSQNARLGFLIAVSAVPAAIVGLLFNELIEKAFTSLEIVAVCFGITAMVLFIGSLDLKVKSTMGVKNAILIGIAQAFAILPGISRSGATISSGLALGLDEKTAVKFSFLMSIPVIFGAGLLELGTGTLDSSYLIPTLVAFAVGLGTIHLLLKIVINSKKNLRWFGVYTLILALGLGAYLILN